MWRRPRAAARRRAGRRVVLLAALCLVFASFSSREAAAANREHQQLMADLRMLQEQTQQLQVSLNALTEVLKQMTSRIDDQGSTARKAFADQRVLIETLSGDVRVVREKLDENNVRISSLAQEIDAVRTTLATLPPPAPAMPTTETGPVDPTAPAETPAPTPVAPSVAGLSPQRLYDSAYADFASGQWSLAITGFEQYIKAFPRTELTDDAQLYIGEAHNFDNKPDLAVAAYDKVIADYPKGDVVPNALYKRGLALLRLQQEDRARESFQTLVTQYPDSEFSRLAKQAIDRLARSGQK